MQLNFSRRPASPYSMGTDDGAPNPATQTNHASYPDAGFYSSTTIDGSPSVAGSATITGLATASTAAPGTNTTQVATTEFVTAAVAAGGGYTLPTASTVVLGGVKIDGTTITINGSGVISAASGGYVLPTASTTVLGGVMIDGTTITIVGGVISARLPQFQRQYRAQSTTSLARWRICAHHR